ncbi:MAG: hypothetical protein IT220_09225 [Flavobacteriaceae bacterium]|nr:hypothetical protein [Flavobacteriaceae bacterium]
MTKEELNKIEERVNKAQKGIWRAYIEGRDHTSGSSFIMTGIGTERGNDIEMFGATEADYDFIANAKQDIPKLIAELRRLTECKLV